jgi:NADH-ubiquinone oxidoreductase chain 6
LLGLDFFAMMFLVVYVGAIAVLFLFVVMMLNIKIAEIHEMYCVIYPWVILLDLFVCWKYFSL